MKIIIFVLAIAMLSSVVFGKTVTDLQEECADNYGGQLIGQEYGPGYKVCGEAGYGCLTSYSELPVGQDYGAAGDGCKYLQEYPHWACCDYDLNYEIKTSPEGTCDFGGTYHPAGMICTLAGQTCYEAMSCGGTMGCDMIGCDGTVGPPGAPCKAICTPLSGGPEFSTTGVIVAVLAVLVAGFVLVKRKK